MLCHSNVSVNLCGCDGTVPQQLLYVTDVNILIKKQCRKRMTEHMWCYMYIVFGHSGILSNDFTNRLLGKAMMQIIDKEESA